MSVITTSGLKSFLEITGADEDDKLDLIVAGVNSAVERFCRREFSQSTFTEYHDGDGYNRHLWLRRGPLVSVTSVNLTSAFYGGELNTDAFSADNLLTENTDFVVSKRDGSIVRVNHFWPEGIENVKVVYVAGYEAIPDDLELAAFQLAAQVRQDAEKGSTVVSERLGDYSYQIARAGTTESLLNAERVFRAYRMPVI